MHSCILAFLPVPLLSAPLDTPLDREAVTRALDLSRGSDRARAAFHARYVTDLPGPVVERIEVISEFRRVVQLAEGRLQIGDWMFTRSPASAERAFEPWRGVTTIAARLRFNPLNVLATVPAYTIVVGALQPSATERSAILAGAGGDAGTTIVGATIESRFDTPALGQARTVVRVVLDGATVAQAAVDFGTLE